MKKLKAFVVFLLLSFYLFATEKPTVALVLSGGGSRGIPELPIIAELDRRGIYPDYILGTSMGSLIGGLYAIGYTPEEIVEVMKTGNLQGKVLNVFNSTQKKTDRAFTSVNDNILALDFNLNGKALGAANGLFDDQYVNAYIRSLIAKVMDVRDFDELSIPFRAIGTNLHNGKKVVFSNGPLFEALRGSMSLPMIFPPLITEDGTYIVDGGTVDNLPIDDAKALGADIIIAIDVNEDVANYGGESENLESLSGAVLQYSVIITQYVVKNKLAEADYLFIPKTRNLSIMDFTNIDGYLKVGQDCVNDNMAMFDELEEILSPYLPTKERVLYRDLPYLTIERVEYPDELNKYKSYLEAFNGKVADETTIEEFELLLDMIRINNHYKNINYKVENGVYKIDIIPFDNLGSSISLGLSGDTGFQFNAFNGGYFNFFFNQTLCLNAHFDFEKVSLDLDFEYGQDLQLSSTLSVPFLKHDYFVTVLLGYGYIPPFGYRKSLNQFKNSNYLIEAETGVILQDSLIGRFDIYMDAGFLFLGDDISFNSDKGNSAIWDNGFLFYTVSHIDYNFKDRTFRTKETRYFEQSVALSFGYSSWEGFVYGIRYDGLFFVPFNPSFNGIYFDVELASMHLPRALTSSYVPDLFHSLVEERIAFSAGYRQLLKKGGKVFYKVGLTGEFTSELYDGEQVPTALDRTLVPFSQLSRFNMALGTGIGFALNDTDVTLFTRIGLYGDMIIGVEIK